jgi:hypothetical protein
VSLFDAHDVADSCWLASTMDDTDGIESNALVSGLVIGKPMKRSSSDVLQLDWGDCITWHTVTDRSTGLDFAKHQDGIFAGNYV